MGGAREGRGQSGRSRGSGGGVSQPPEVKYTQAEGRGGSPRSRWKARGSPGGPRLPRITLGALVPSPHLCLGFSYRRIPLGTFQAPDSGDPRPGAEEGTGERPAGEVGRGAEWGVAEWPVFSGWVGALGTGFRAPLGQGGRRREPTAEVRPPGGGKGWAENAQNFSGGRDLTPDSSMTQILGCLRAAVKSGANPGKEMGVVSSRPPLRGVILGKSEPCQVLQRNHLLSRASRS